MKRSQPKRDWSQAIAKLDAEAQCRNCGTVEGLQASHTIGRAAQDAEIIGPRGAKFLLVPASAIVPLCRDCHTAYDRRELDILPVLHIDEEVAAVKAAGGIFAAYRRTAPLAFKEEANAARRV